MNVDDGLLAEPGAEGRRSTGADAEESGMRLRLARQARGFSQQQLATMAGVSRQAVSAVEAGLSDPSLRVALALSRSLGLTVEEMFGPATAEPRVEARPLARLDQGGSRVSLAQVGDAFVVAPLSGAAATRTGFVPAGGFADEWGPKIGVSARAVRPLARHGPRSWSLDATLPSPCWRSRSVCSTHPYRCSGGSAPARKHWSWPRTGWSTRLGAIYGTSRVTTTLARLDNSSVKELMWSAFAPGGKAWCCDPTWPAALLVSPT